MPPGLPHHLAHLPPRGNATLVTQQDKLYDHPPKRDRARRSWAPFSQALGRDEGLLRQGSRGASAPAALDYDSTCITTTQLTTTYHDESNFNPRHRELPNTGPFFSRSSCATAPRSREITADASSSIFPALAEILGTESRIANSTNTSSRLWERRRTASSLFRLPTPLTQLTAWPSASSVSPSSSGIRRPDTHRDEIFSTSPVGALSTALASVSPPPSAASVTSETLSFHTKTGHWVRKRTSSVKSLAQEGLETVLGICKNATSLENNPLRRLSSRRARPLSQQYSTTMGTCPGWLREEETISPGPSSTLVTPSDEILLAQASRQHSLTRPTLGRHRESDLLPAVYDDEGRLPIRVQYVRDDLPIPCLLYGEWFRKLWSRTLRPPS